MYISYVKIEPNNFVGEGITWSFSGDEENSWRWCQGSFSSCSERVTINPNNSITLIDSEFKDIGIYTCEIRSLAGRVSKSKTTYFPDLNAESHTESNHEYYEEGKNVLLDCTFEVILSKNINPRNLYRFLTRLCGFKIDYQRMLSCLC